MGPILEEFKEKRVELVEKLSPQVVVAKEAKENGKNLIRLNR